MRRTWYYQERDRKIGPVTEEQLKALYASGEVSAAALVQSEGGSGWKRFEQVPALCNEGEEQAVCVMTGERRPIEELLMFAGHWVLPEYLDALIQKLEESGGTLVMDGDSEEGGQLELRPVGQISALTKTTLRISLLFYAAAIVLAGLSAQFESQARPLLAVGGFCFFAFCGMVCWTGINFLVWKFRCAVNAHLISTGALEIQPKWCVGLYFVPFLNLTKPFEAMIEICEAFFGEHSKERDGLHLGLWWTLWTQAVVVGFFQNYICNQLVGAGLDPLGVRVGVGSFLIGATVIIGILLIRIITKVTAKQIELSPLAA